ncbi:hypothetical protein [Tychonema sp. LEGE 07196]|uniref:hypothetical protein n=1 Tax=Tychonema sp. LEGE 07196 TaxID=1828665 RepID=UPI0030DA67DF
MLLLILKVIGYWLLVIGYWLLVISCWLLVVGYWLLVIGGHSQIKSEKNNALRPNFQFPIPNDY